jgi:hypothetical protein
MRVFSNKNNSHPIFKNPRRKDQANRPDPADRGRVRTRNHLLQAAAASICTCILQASSGALPVALAAEMAANLEDVPSLDLMHELLRRMKCSSKPDKRLIVIGTGDPPLSPSSSPLLALGGSLSRFLVQQGRENRGLVPLVLSIRRKICRFA